MFYYLAYMNKPGNWSIENLNIMFSHAKEHRLALRTWINEESQLILLVIETPFAGEDTGSELYEKMKGNFDGYGLASDYEFNSYGIPIDAQTEGINIFTRIYGSYPPLPQKKPA